MKSFRKIFFLLTAQERWQIPIQLILMIISMATEIIGVGLVIPVLAFMTKPHLDKSYPILQPYFNMLNNPTQAQLVIGGLLALVGMYFIKSLFMIFMLWKQSKFIYDIQANLSRRLFVGYLQQPWAFHLQRNSAQLILNSTHEVNLFIANVLQPSLTIITEGFVLLGITLFLLVIQPVGTLLTVGIFAIAGLASHYLVRDPLLRWGKSRQHHEGLRIQHIQQGLGGAKDVKLLGREQEFFIQYDRHNLAGVNVGKKQKLLLELPRLWLELLAVTSLAILVITMIYQGVELESLLLTLGAFTAGAFRLILIMNRVLGSLQNLRYALPVINTLSEEMKLVDCKIAIESKATFPLLKELSLQHINYQYPNVSKLSLDNITIQIQAGTSVGFIGASGAGKSTLVDIILGLLTPNSGKVKIDNIDIQSNLRGWQDQIGYVPQSIYLTDDTLRRNIAFGLSDDLIDNQALQGAIKAAQLDSLIDSLPEGVDTLVGERGVRLSGGQRQRIGIARALYHDPAVLVLDEATSSLDTATEKEVMEAVYALHGTKTLLIVAHRLTTVARCDVLYKMQHGKIIASGNLDTVTVDKLVTI